MDPDRKAPRQVAAPQTFGPQKYSAAEASKSENYNIWYHKEPGRRPERGRDAVATSRCVAARDVGRTVGDSRPGAYICLEFARGRCSHGDACSFLHRVPDAAFEARLTQFYDCFGRTRHATHRDDMDGVGSFESDLYAQRTLFVGNVTGPEREAEATLRTVFQEWGALEYVRVLSDRGAAFVRFALRSCAEFAKEAMQAQPLPPTGRPLAIRWAHTDPNPHRAERRKREAETRVLERVAQRARAALGEAGLAAVLSPEQHYAAAGPAAPTPLAYGTPPAPGEHERAAAAAAAVTATSAPSGVSAVVHDRFAYRPLAALVRPPTATAQPPPPPKEEGGAPPTGSGTHAGALQLLSGYGSDGSDRDAEGGGA